VEVSPQATVASVLEDNPSLTMTPCVYSSYIVFHAGMREVSLSNLPPSHFAPQQCPPPPFPAAPPEPPHHTHHCRTASWMAILLQPTSNDEHCHTTMQHVKQPSPSTAPPANHTHVYSHIKQLQLLHLYFTFLCQAVSSCYPPSHTHVHSHIVSHVGPWS